MTKTQAKRLAYVTEAYYIIYGGETACMTDHMSDDDIDIFKNAQQDMAYMLLKKAGFDINNIPESIDDAKDIIFRKVQK